MAVDERERAPSPAGPRPPLWRDLRVIRAALQIAFVVTVAAVVWYLYQTLLGNLRAAGIRTDFGFLEQPAGFTLLGTDFGASQPVWQAIVQGLYNTLRASLVGIVLAMVLGTVVGVARLSTNWLVRRAAGLFVESLRNVPLLVLILFFYLAVLQQLPTIGDAYEPLGLLVLSNRGLYTPWFAIDEGAEAFLAVIALAVLVAVVVAVWRTRRFDATGQPHHRVLWGIGTFLAIAVPVWLALGRPVALSLPVRDGRLIEGGVDLSIEYGALLVALTLYTAAFIAEIVRGSIQAVPKGQGEAANALGLTAFQRLRFVVLPQALRVATPPTGNEFLNLTKNSSLGIVIAFPELLRVTRIVIAQGQPAPQLIFIMLVIYLVISLVLSALTNLVNRRLELKER